jgi:hypothetical protein
MVETSNPLMRNIAGRLQVFEQIKDLPPEERAAAIELITTGQSDAFTRKSETCLMRIRWENEQLAQGKPVQVLSLDDPFKHVPAHFAEIEARSSQLMEDPMALQAFLQHIGQHQMEYLNLSPIMAAFMMIPPPPDPMAMAAGMPMLPGASMAAGPAGPANDNGGGAPAKKKPAESDPSGVKLPTPAKPPEGSATQAKVA